MSHEITATDRVYSVREPMWHGINDDVIEDYPTPEEARLWLPWKVIQEPVYRRVISIENGSPTERYEEITDFRANTRDDTDEVLGVVTSSLGVVQNSTLFDIAEVLEGVDKGSVKYETGGSLQGGRKVWLLLRLNEPVCVKGDPHGEMVPFYAMQNSHDGRGGGFRGMVTWLRIVCGNTAHAADLDAEARGTIMKFNHTSTVAERIEEAKKALVGWREGVRAFRLQSENLMQIKVTPRQRELFVTEFIPEPLPHLATLRVMRNVEASRQALRDILSSETCEGINDNAYGLVCAGTEYRNWAQAARSKVTRFQRSVLSRDQIITDAVKLAQEVAMV